MGAITRITVIAVCFVLSACSGGGGGGDSASAPPPAPPTTSPTTQFSIAGAFGAFWQSTHNYTLTATDAQNNSYTAQLSMTPGPNGTFRGQATNTSSSSVILKKNGATVSASTGTDYFLSSPYSFVGTANSDGSCDVGRDQHALPSYATVGQRSCGPSARIPRQQLGFAWCLLGSALLLRHTPRPGPSATKLTRPETCQL